MQAHRLIGGIYVGLVSAIYLQRFLKIGSGAQIQIQWIDSGIHKLIGEVHRHTHTDSMETAQAYFRKEGQEKRERMLSSRK
jgi:hypothetical protein